MEITIISIFLYMMVLHLLEILFRIQILLITTLTLSSWLVNHGEEFKKKWDIRQVDDSQGSLMSRTLQPGGAAGGGREGYIVQCQVFCRNYSSIALDPPERWSWWQKNSENKSRHKELDNSEELSDGWYYIRHRITRNKEWNIGWDVESMEQNTKQYELWGVWCICYELKCS